MESEDLVSLSLLAICVSFGEIAAFSEPVSHLLNSNLLLQCVVRKNGDSLTHREWKYPSASQSYCIHLPSQSFTVLRIFTEMISCCFLVLSIVTTCLPTGFRIGLCIRVLRREILQLASKGSLETESPLPWGISTDSLSFLPLIGCGPPPR